MTKAVAWKDLAESIGLVAVVVSLALLLIEVRENSLAIKQQASLARAEAITAPYFESDLAGILTKVAAVDGDFGMPARFVERYELTDIEAVIWERHLWHVWEVMQASFITEGSSEELDRQIRLLLLSPSNQLYLTNAMKYQFSAPFRQHVRRLSSNQADFVKSLEQGAK